MNRRVFSIAGLMLGIAVAAVPISQVVSMLSRRPVLGLSDTLDMGVWLPATVLAAALASRILKGGRCGRFAAGFQVAGWSAAIASVLACRAFPDWMTIPYVFYVNRVEGYLMDADTIELYALSLMIGGLPWGTVIVVVALLGGGLAAIVGRRTTVIDRGPLPGADSPPAV